MADTLERSLTSVLSQLGDGFEVVVVDDGSSDSSVEVIERMQGQYSILKLVKLKRDRKRKLGFTRNISIQEARGEYVLLNVDCDDVYGPFIKDFVTIYHQLEECLKKDFYLSGENINMAKRDFLLKHGPYNNVFRCEDRDLWRRMASIDSFIPLEHESFVTRLPKEQMVRVKRVFVHTWDQLVFDFRTGLSFSGFLKAESNRKARMSLSLRMMRISMLFPAMLAAKFYRPLSYAENMKTTEDFLIYRTKVKGTFPEIMRRYDGQADFSVISQDGRRLFQ